MNTLKNLLLVASAVVVTGTTSLSAAVTVGQPAPDFTLTDTLGNTHRLSDYAGKIVVLEWINNGCPFVQRHYVNSSNMQTLQQTYTGQDVVWLSICSSGPAWIQEVSAT